MPKKMAFLYGENGAGKSNLIRSLLFMSHSFQTLNTRQILPDFKISDLNDEQIREKIISDIMQKKFLTLQDLIRENRTINVYDPMAIKIGFYHNGKEGYYYARFNTNEKEEAVIQEQLYFTLNKRAGMMFDIRNGSVVLSPSSFPDAKYAEELTELIAKYWGKHTFMAILYNELTTKNQQYSDERLSGSLRSVLHLLNQLGILYKGAEVESGKLIIPFRFLHQLDKGYVESKDNQELMAMENFLQQCFTQLYSDIKNVYYRFSPSGAGYAYELCFRKICNGLEMEVPISLESMGTRKILDLFPLIFTSTLSKPVVADEIDSGIHDLLMQDIVKILRASLAETPEGQFIATTHNTLLLDCLETENVYILKSDALGNKEISCVTEYPRTHKNNSMRHRYLNGIYQGIPGTGYLDFKELVEEVVDQIGPKAVR